MTPEEQRNVIATACGWSLDHIRNGAMYYVPSADYHVGDPLSDLNACHEMEKFLRTEYQQNEYFLHVSDITRGNGETGYREHLFNNITATAAQRAEAFLKTLELWT